MDENNKTIVEVTDEGIIFVNYLTADYEFLFNLIMNKSCHLEIASEEGYLALTLGWQNPAMARPHRMVWGVLDNYLW